jgi:hypothetical protein
MLCEFDSNSVCVKCKKPTRFPGYFRECCGIGECNERGVQEPPIEVARPYGPGTELKSLLAGWPFRIVASPDCKCTSRAAYMDAQGCDWCESEEGMAEIMGFLREAAEERGLPFLDAAGRLLVKRAIHNARKAEARRARGSQRHD